MRTQYVKCVCVLFVGAFACDSLYAFDVCDSVDVSKKLNEIKQSNTYESCSVENLSDKYKKASNRFISIQELLKDTYEDAVTTIKGPAQAAASVTDFKREAGQVKTYLSTPPILDVLSASSIDQMLDWTHAVHDLVLDITQRVNIIDMNTLSGAKKFQVCEAKFHWREVDLWRDRIDECVVVVCTKNLQDTQNLVGSYKASTDANGRNGDKGACDSAALAVKTYSKACKNITSAIPVIDCDKLFD